MSVIDKIKNKRILIWGYGREGQSTRQFLKRCCEPSQVDVLEGKREEIDEDKYDLIIKSPGIRMDDDDPKYTSQTELFLEEYRDQVIGITGTKGKSTTSTMLKHVLTRCMDSKTDVILLGNIGEPCLDYFDEITPDTLIVFEMSCHQLAHVRVSPHIAVFLNLYEEHLDYYDTLERYFAAKANITRYQRPGDYFLKGENVPDIQTAAEVINMPYDTSEDYHLQILGGHNVYNANVVIHIACELLGIDRERVIESLAGFKGLPHRLEYIGEADDIRYYDDSISTIPYATLWALKSVPEAKTVLIGGMDRGIDYSELTEFIKSHPEYNYICSYDSGRRIYDEVSSRGYCYYEETLEKAVRLARRITPPGCACILSPASPSYGYFKNFEQRGEVFKSLTVEAGREYSREVKGDKPVLAICYDFDKTLSPDDMQAQGYIQDVYGEDVAGFWGHTDDLSIDNEMDSNLAYMFMMKEEAEGKTLFTRKVLADYGSKVALYDGVETWFERVRKFGEEHGVIVEHYIISSGLKEMIEGTAPAKAGAFKKIYASSFYYNDKGVAVWPAQAVNYTNKTQFLFRIEKGVLDVNDAAVNDYFPPEKLRVPFRNMIYIGDSATDIPCMKLVNSYGGHSIGVYDPVTCDKSKVHQMIRNNRIRYFAPADYTPGGELETIVHRIILRTAVNEALENTKNRCEKEARAGAEP